MSKQVYALLIVGIVWVALVTLSILLHIFGVLNDDMVWMIIVGGLVLTVIFGKSGLVD